MSKDASQPMGSTTDKTKDKDQIPEGGGGGMGSLVDGAGKLIGPFRSVISVQSKRLAEDINNVYDKQIIYTTKIHHQRSRIEDLKFRIARTEKELEDKRKIIGPDTAQATKGRITVTEREIHKMENRLQQTLKKASMLDAENDRRKERVNCLRRENMAEVKARERLEAELERARTICANTARAAQQMVDEKEKTRREMELLKQEVVKDLEAFREDFQDVTENLAAAKEATQESNAKLENMARCAPAAITIEDINEGVGGAAGGSLADSGDGGAQGEGRIQVSQSVQPLSRAQRLGQHSNMTFWLILKKKNDLQAKAARVQELRMILEKISTATSLATVDDFVPVMLEAEEENYNLFKLINELNTELEELEHEKSVLSESIQRLTQAGSKHDQHAVKLSLQQQIDRSRAAAELYDQAYSRDVEVIKSVEESLISVFNKVGSSDKAVSKQLIAMGVTDRNILLFLGQIEEQIEHIVQVYNVATDSAAVPNVRRPLTPLVNQATGERVPSTCTPHPPSSETIDDILGVIAEDDADGANRPIDIARVAATIKEQVLRMPQGARGAGVLGGKGRRPSRAILGSMFIQAGGRAKTKQTMQGEDGQGGHWRTPVTSPAPSRGDAGGAYFET